jgi:hypothetical protein
MDADALPSLLDFDFLLGRSTFAVLYSSSLAKAFSILSGVG